MLAYCTVLYLHNRTFATSGACDALALAVPIPSELPDAHKPAVD